MVALGDVATVGAGNSAPQDEELFKKGTYSFIRTSDVGKIHIGVISKSKDKLNSNGIQGLKLQPAGTVLFPKSGASTFLNHRVLMTESAYVSSHLSTIKANNEILLDGYLYYYLQTIDARDLCQDQAYPSLNRDQIAGIHIPLPSLSEQKAIVEKLDAAFAEIDALEANLETKSRYTSELLNSTLGSVFSGDGVHPAAHQGPAMKMVRLEDLCSISTGSTDTKDAVVDGAYPLFDRSKIIKKSTKYLFDCEALIIPGEGAEFLPKYYSGKFDLHQRAYALFDMKSELDIQFLKYYLIFVKDYFPRVAVGATVKSLRRRHFADLEIPLPSLPEQKAIVEKLDAAFAEIDALRDQIIIAKVSFTALRQSILSSAFTEESDVA